LLSAGLRWSLEPRCLRHGEWLLDVNSAYRKECLIHASRFFEDLELIDKTGALGEAAASLLLDRCGVQLFYDPGIVVRRRIPVERLTKEWFRRSAFWQGVVSARLEQYPVGTVPTSRTVEPSTQTLLWQEISVPISARAWADLFDDRSSTDFEQQLDLLKQLGCLFQSQRLVLGYPAPPLSSSLD
jgi:hypothetical protein